MAAEDYSVPKYNNLLADVDGGPFFIEESGEDDFALYKEPTELITHGDYEHVAKRAFQILKENGLHYYLEE